MQRDAIAYIAMLALWFACPLAFCTHHADFLHLGSALLMGWLRDLMKAAQPPPRSFDDLARRCLSHATWPAEFRVQGRSLGALLGKFDRELELDWLAHRPGAQRTLALVLGTTREQVLEGLAPSRTTPGRYVRLDDLPSGRLLDLNEEPLFPGIPPEVLTPGAWDALWWQAP